MNREGTRFNKDKDNDLQQFLGDLKSVLRHTEHKTDTYTVEFTLYTDEGHKLEQMWTK